MNIIQFLLPASDVTISASFDAAPVLYTTTAKTANSAHGTATASASSVTSGMSVTFSAVSKAGYTFSKWSGGSTSTSNPITLPITANTTLTAHFTANPTYTNPPSTVIIGSVEWATTSSMPNLGGKATFQATPYVYDGENQITWHEATTGVEGSTSGVSGNTGKGVCPSGWRLPTHTEFQALFNASAVGNISGGYGIGTWSTISGTVGLTFATTSGSLFFSASGYNANGQQGLSGFCWSSIESTATRAFHLSFSETYSLPANDGTKTSRRSIRCVRSV